MSASQSGNFSTSRRVMHEPRGASRLYCPINQNEPGMATAVSAALRSESLFPATMEAARPPLKILDRDPRPSAYQGHPRGHGGNVRERARDLPEERTTPAESPDVVLRASAEKSLNRTCGGWYFTVTFIVISTTCVYAYSRVSRYALYFPDRRSCATPYPRCRTIRVCWNLERAAMRIRDAGAICRRARVKVNRRKISTRNFFLLIKIIDFSFY